MSNKHSLSDIIITVSSSSTAIFIIFLCYGKVQFEDNKHLKLKEAVTVFYSKAAEPIAHRHSHLSFVSSLWCTWLYIFLIQIFFLKRHASEKHIFVLSWLSDTRCYLSGIAKEKIHWLANCKKSRMSTVVTRDYSTQYSSLLW